MTWDVGRSVLGCEGVGEMWKEVWKVCWGVREMWKSVLGCEDVWG